MLRYDKGPLVSKSETKYAIDEEGFLTYDGLLYVPNDNELKLSLLCKYHDSSTTGHPGQAKTLELLSRNWYWPSMKKYVNRYVSNCQICARAKPRHNAPFGELRSLEIPKRPWSSISMDFIVGLPECLNYNSIWVIVDRFTKQAHFVPTVDTMTAKELADLFLREVFRLHGMPDDIVSDRDSLFTSKYWKKVTELLGIKRNLSTAFHPQTDGQTERVNQQLEQYLRIFTSYQQDEWVQLLPMAEFSYNNVIHSSTNMSPFYANFAHHPSLHFRASASASDVPAAGHLVQKLHDIHEELTATTTLAQKDHAKYYNQGRTKPPVFKVGDQVYVSRRNMPTSRPSRKLDHKYLGPFEILQQVSSHAYRLQLPSTVHQHPVFHVQELTPAVNADLPDIPGHRQPPLPPMIVNGEEEYEVQGILNSRHHRNKLQYLIKWKGYEDPSENSWEDEENVANAKTLVDAFHKKYPGKPGPLTKATKIKKAKGSRKTRP